MGQNKNKDHKINMAQCKTAKCCSAKSEPSETEEQIELESEVKGAKPSKHDAGVSDLEKVTDFAEEKEIASQDIQEAMKAVSDRQKSEAKAKKDKEKELSKVKIN